MLFTRQHAAGHCRTGTREITGLGASRAADRLHLRRQLSSANFAGVARAGLWRTRTAAVRPRPESVAFIAPVFETGDPRYQWLNDIQAAANGTLSADLSQVDYEVAELR